MEGTRVSHHAACGQGDLSVIQMLEAAVAPDWSVICTCGHHIEPFGGGSLATQCNSSKMHGNTAGPCCVIAELSTKLCSPGKSGHYAAEPHPDTQKFELRWILPSLSIRILTILESDAVT